MLLKQYLITFVVISNINLAYTTKVMMSSIRRSGEHITRCFPEEYEVLLLKKVQTLKDLLFQSIETTESIQPDVFRSPKTNFRMRTNFNIWRDKPKSDDPVDMYYAMFEKDGDKNLPVEIKSFPRGSLLINSLMERLMEVIKDHPSLRKSLFEVRFVTTQANEAVISLIYKKPLVTTEWQAAADTASTILNAKIVGRSKKVKLVAGGGETVKEILNVNGRALCYYQTEGAFSQPNASVCEKMLEWALDVTSGSVEEDLLELYCGGGTFTAALAINFRKVLATEMSKASVELAHQAFKENKIENIRIARLSSEEFTQAYEGKRR